MIIAVISFIIILALLVLVHEWGHFFAARKFGCKVEEFGFGFPPRIFGKRLKKDGPNGTLYSFNWIPLGGFVKIKGEQGESRDDSDSFAHKKPWQRALILGGGVLMNVVLAFVLLSIGFGVGVPQVIDETVGSGAQIKDQKIVVVEVLPDSPAASAGIEPGDTIVGYVESFYSEETNCEGNNDPACGQTAQPGFSPSIFASIEDMQNYFDKNIGKELLLPIRKQDEQVHEYVTIVPHQLEGVDRGGIGVALVETGVVSYPFYMAPVKGAQATVSLTGQILVAFGGLIRDIAVKQEVSVDVTGPVGIAVLTGQVVDQGIVYLIYFVALLSLNLAIINFLPFPALDGGRFLFLIIEKIRRKPVNQRVEGVIHMIGFALLLLLVLLVTVRDVIQLF